MKKLLITILLIAIGLSGCDSNHPLKRGYEGTRSDVPEIHKAVKAQIKAQGIEFYTFNDSGMEVAAYRKEDKKRVKAILKEIIGGPPDSYTGLCYETLSSAEKQYFLLSSKKIPSMIKKSYSSHCVYWEKNYSDQVASIDSSFREIREHQRTLGNEI